MYKCMKFQKNESKMYYTWLDYELSQIINIVTSA